MLITNNTGIPLPLAVWLVADGYDFRRGERRAISATSLLKGVRKILLAERLDDENRLSTDVTDLIASRLGHTIHDGIEKAWTNDYVSSMQKLGVPGPIIDRVKINPTDAEVRASNSIIPVYLEQRSEKEIMGYTVTGKFDMIIEGVLQDFKSTSTFAAKGGKDKDYQLQGSIYRWLNPEKVTADYMVINFIFTDWQKFRAKASADYPQSRVMPHRVPLLSLAETEAWIVAKFKALEAAADLPENLLPRCTEEDLWRSDPTFKFYLDPAKAALPKSRCTKSCESMAEALEYQKTKGGRGVIIETPGVVKACSYCPCWSLCSQKDEYEHG